MRHDASQLQCYFERIGYRGPPRADVATLHALTRAHTQAIPFENIAVLLGQPIRLQPEALHAKLVDGHRGGYCFEQNGLLLDVLQQLGFAVRPLGARVRLGTPDRDILPGRTHMLLEVVIDGACWLTDVGVGAASLTAPLLLEPDREQTTPHDSRRLQRDGERWFHQLRRDNTWLDVYEFTRETMPMADRKVANWYTATHPDSHFTTRLTAALARPDGGRTTLADHTLTVRQHDGSAHKRELAEHELPDGLRRHFGIDLPPDTQLPSTSRPCERG